jgi:hypothetical protein
VEEEAGGGGSMSLQENLDHAADCSCVDCVNRLLMTACKKTIEQQIEIVVGIMSDLEAPELIPVLRTLQFVRDNQAVIRGAVKKGVSSS